MNAGESFVFQGSISCPNCGVGTDFNIDMTSNLQNLPNNTNPILTSQLIWTVNNTSTNTVILLNQDWPQNGGSINFDMLIVMPFGTPCGSNFNFAINVNSSPITGDETDTITLTTSLAKPILTLALPMCSTTTNCVVQFGAAFSAIQYSMSAIGWTINGNALPWTTTSSNTSVTLTKPAGFTGNATLTVTINGCSTSQTFWVGPPAAPAALWYDQWIGHNCYSWVDWADVPGAVSYQYQTGAGTGTTFGSTYSTTYSHTTTGWAPSYTFHVRVRTLNGCGTSVWQVLQGTTPASPTYPNCNGN